MSVLKTLRAGLLGATAAVGLIAAQPALATEGGSQYPNGAEGFMAGAVPPPGLYMVNYAMHYHASRINDKNGNKLPFKTNLNATAEVPRIVYTSPYKILGANWGAHILVPLVRTSYNIAGFQDNGFGVGDITINPFILSWHWKNFHLATGVDINMPTGNYDRHKMVNIGANYWGIEPLIAASYVTDGGFEVSAKFMYTYNTTNNTTDYKSGSDFHMDYMVAQKFGDWTLGVGGYWFHQLTDDKINGRDVDNRGKAFAVGPAIKYDFNGMSLIGKWQHETMSENRPQGDKFWLKFIMAF